MHSLRPAEMPGPLYDSFSSGNGNDRDWTAGSWNITGNLYGNWTILARIRAQIGANVFGIFHSFSDFIHKVFIASEFCYVDIVNCT